jgi:glutamyl-tRNA synthetase
LGEVIHPCRLALTGRLESPPMYDVIEILGPQKTADRLKRAISFLEEG